jgi:hypothetical protein
MNVAFEIGVNGTSFIPKSRFSSSNLPSCVLRGLRAFVCATRRLVPCGDERAPLVACRSRRRKAEGSPTWRRREGWQAALTTPGRPGTARQLVPGKRDGKVCESDVLKPLNTRPAPTWWIWAGEGCTPDARATPKSLRKGRPGGHGEGLRRTHGEAPGAQLGTHPIERFKVNVGTTRRRPPANAPRGRWEGSPSADGVGGDIVPVVVRGRESRPHGEGGQRDRSGSTAMPGGRR